MIGLDLSLSLVGQRNLLSSAIQTYFLTFNGTTAYGSFATPWVSTDGNWTAEVVFEGGSVNNTYLLDSGSAVTNRLYIYRLDDTINWNTSLISSATLDGVGITSGVTAYPDDGKLHTLVLTGSASANCGIVSSRYNETSRSDAIIKSLKLTDLTITDNSREYTIDSQSLAYEQDDLNPSDVTKRLLYNNVVAGDWSGAWTYNPTSADCGGGAGWEHETETTICEV